MTTLAGLLEMAAVHNAVLADEIWDGSQKHDVTAARHQVCCVLRRSGWSFPAIGLVLGRDHRSVMNACRKAKWDGWMFGVYVAPPGVRAGGPLVERSGPVKAGEGRASSDTVTVAANGSRMQGLGATTEPDNCIVDETGVATTRTTCMDCPAAPMPGGCLRCLRCFHAWLDEKKGPMRGTSKPKATGEMGRTPVKHARFGVKRGTR